MTFPTEWKNKSRVPNHQPDNLDARPFQHLDTACNPFTLTVLQRLRPLLSLLLLLLLAQPAMILHQLQYLHVLYYHKPQTTYDMQKTTNHKNKLQTVNNKQQTTNHKPPPPPPPTTTTTTRTRTRTITTTALPGTPSRKTTKTVSTTGNSSTLRLLCATQQPTTYYPLCLYYLRTAAYYLLPTE